MKKWKISWWECAFVGLVFLVLLYLAVTSAFDSAPDESMRFQIVQYMYHHWGLPDGRDPEIRNANWGISYAFNPILPYMIGSMFARIVILFTKEFPPIYIAARMVNVLLGTLTSVLVLKIGKALFEKEQARFFAALVCFLPGFLFLHSYINTDAVALFASAWIILCWVKVLKQGWTGRICLELGTAMAVCMLSYYNAYGYLLCSAVFFVGTMMKCQKKQWDCSQMFRKGMLMLLVVALLAGWWFVRSAILYDGDFLGMATSSKYAEMYAIEELKPSNRETPQNMGMSLLYMMFWVPGKWNHNWMITVLYSFIGTFGHMDIFMPEWWSKAYVLLIGVGAVGCLPLCGELFLVNRKETTVKKEKDSEGTIKTKIYRYSSIWDIRKWMYLCLLLAAVLPCILLLYYAYASDFQAQGRYIMPMIFPLMIFLTIGYENLSRRCIRNEKIRNMLFRILTVVYMASGILTFVFVK